MTHTRILTTAVFAAAIFSQAAAAEANDADDGEIITLEEFSVSSAALKDTYIAPEATGGTRTGEKIINIPYSIQVFTEDFINDFQLFDEEDIFPFIGGATGHTGEIASETRVRGFKTLQTRDGFSRSIPSTPSNTLQTEIIKGPLSTLYGRASPGGIVNKISRRPRQKSSIFTSATYGTDDYLRASLRSTGALAPAFTKKKLFYYAYYEYRHTETTEDFIEMDKHFLGFSLLYKFNKNTSLYLTGEYQPERSVEGSGGAIWRAASGNTAANPGIRGWTGIGSFAQRWAPDSFRDCDYMGVNALFEHRINTTWAARAALQGYRKDTYKERWSGATVFYDSTRTFSSRNPYLRDDLENSYSAQVDLLANFKTNAITRMDHRLLLAADAFYFRHSSLEKQTDDVTIAVDPLIPDACRYLSIDADYGDRNVFIPFDFSLLRHHYSDFLRHRRSYGAFASYRLSLHKARLALMGSGRYDYIDDSLDNHVTGEKSTGSEGKFTYSVGLNYYILGEKFLLYASASTAFLPPGTVDRGLGALVKPQTSSGIEFGFKGATPNSTLGYTVSFYKIRLENVAIENDDFYENIHLGSGTVPEYLTDNEFEVKGIDASIFIKPADGLVIQATLGYTDSLTTGENDDANGRPMERVSKWNGSLITRYAFTHGLFEGTSVGIAATCQSEYIAYHENTSSNTPEVVRPGLFLLNAFVSYEWKMGRYGKYTHKLALNGSNILDKEYYYRNGRAARGAEARITYTLKF